MLLLLTLKSCAWWSKSQRGGQDWQQQEASPRLLDRCLPSGVRRTSCHALSKLTTNYQHLPPFMPSPPFSPEPSSFLLFPLRLSKREVWEPFSVTLAFLCRLNVLALFSLTASLLICHDYCWIFQLSFPNVNQWLSTSPLSYLHSKQPFPSKWSFLPFHPLKGACLQEKSILC